MTIAQGTVAYINGTSAVRLEPQRAKLRIVEGGGGVIRHLHPYDMREERAPYAMSLRETLRWRISEIIAPHSAGRYIDDAVIDDARTIRAMKVGIVLSTIILCAAVVLPAIL